MPKSNPYIDKAIHQAKVLRQIILKMNEKDRAIEADADEAEAELRAKQDSTDYPTKKLKDFFEGDKVDDTWEPEDKNEEILFLVDRILYKLLDYSADDKWVSDKDYDERVQLRLKEVIK